MAPSTLRAHSAAGELSVRALEKTYGESPLQKRVVSDCSFVVERGKLTAMIGPSGCGKSSLVRLLAGFDAPDTGTIELDGRVVSEPGRDRLVLFQESALFPWMTTYDNILYGPRARSEVDKQTLELAEVLLERVGLQAFRHKYPAQLSGGMQRRVELARALINHPKVMLLDEPFRGLDALTKELMWGYYASLLQESSRTSLFVTTDIDEAVCLADRILIMTNLPTRVREIIEVDLPRPRVPADLTSPRANEIKRQALALLTEEASRSFKNKSTAPANSSWT
jgi:NitT/TauT family transport system ATP-binding protein